MCVPNIYHKARNAGPGILLHRATPSNRIMLQHVASSRATLALHSGLNRLVALALSNQQLATAAAERSTADSKANASSQAKQWYEQSSLFYSNYPLNRAADARRDADQVLAWFNSPNARVTPVNGSHILVTKDTQTAAFYGDAEGVSPSASSNSSSNDASIPGTTSNNGSSGNGQESAPAAVQATSQPVFISPAAELGLALHPDVPPLFLGLSNASTPFFAVQIASASIANDIASHYNAKWVSARTAGPELSRVDAALMAVASGLAQWHLDAQYHGSTGSKTQPQDGGYSRKCPTSGRVLYPRIDPAIITLVTAGEDWCLLGSKSGWPGGRYSTLAGFLELGETLEQALCREVAEESGVVVDLHSVRYVASQPWPFPRSLMVGFYASAATDAVGNNKGGGNGGSSGSSSDGTSVVLSQQGRKAMMDSGIRSEEVSTALSACPVLQTPIPQEGEMQDVRWFHRDWLLQAIQQGPAAAPGNFQIPGSYSLAHHLITGWLYRLHPATVSNGSSGSSGSSDTASTSGGQLGDTLPQVQIDEGVFKYVLLRLTDRQTGRSKLLVRGSAAAAYHNHILQHTKAEAQRLVPDGALQVDVLGGGRIVHYPEQKVISVYGYSAAFGPAVHEVTVGLLRKWYPFYDPDGITYSYDGY